MLSPGAIFELKIHQNAFGYSSPRTPRVLRGRFEAGEGGRGGKWRGGERGGMGAFLHCFFYNLTTDCDPIELDPSLK